MFSKYRKTIIAIVGAAVAIATFQFGDNAILQAAVGLLTALGVYGVPNA